ncbi:MAG: tetratricopeptide repeat protein [Chloroflexi bacterium]|nr:tetratricopeptide repeat protein [Chloroflexota bacterium]
MTLGTIGQLLYARGDYQEAERALEEVLERRQSSGLQESVELALALNDLAATRRALGKTDGVEELYQRSLAMRRQLLGPDDPAVAESLNNLAGVRMAAGRLDEARQYMQHHGGVFRTQNYGESWEDIGDGLPETFGFPIVSHPGKPGTIWVIPNQGGEFRASSSGAFRVFKSEDSGDSWRAVTDGLPQEAAYLTTLRESMAVDGAEPLGVYVGTKAGTLFGSTDEGESWHTVVSALPPILSLEAAVV